MVYQIGDDRVRQRPKGLPASHAGADEDSFLQQRVDVGHEG
jgi:hypothetical protein